uniref:Proteasomal ATPase-associated factor 1 n=2 Tax=Lygus hesperus TaxID=30085 RepID=A0A0A9WM83_LYGHE
MTLECHPEFMIQCDWNVCLKELGCKVWITLKEKDQKGIHGTICRITANEGQPTATDGFKVLSYLGNSLHVGHESTGRTTIFLPPVKTMSDIHKTSVGAICLNASGHAVTASADGKLIVWDTVTEKLKHDLKGHVGDVYRCRFFPSGEVVLSSGSDMRLIIWCAKTGVKAVTLTGHTMAVTDVGFVDRGRNVISVSKDGTLKLWNCGDSSCLATVFKHSAGVNCCCLFTPQGMDLGEPTTPISDKECGTKGKAVLIGCEDGQVVCIALHSRKVLFSVTTPSAVNCIADIENESFIIGCQDGSVHLYSLKSPSSPKKSWHSSNSTVHSIVPYKKVGVFSSRADGNIAFNFLQIPNVSLNLTGADADPVYDLALSSGLLYSCSRDSTIRVYSPLQLINKIVGKVD